MDQNFFRLGVRNVLRYFETDDVVRNVPKDLLAFDGQTIGSVEGSDDLLVTLQTEGAQENRRQELSFAIDADVKDALRCFVLEFDPGAAVWNDLPEEIALAWS